MGSYLNNFQVFDSRITAVLGPTNTGKTHLAMERMLGHKTGMIGLPLRLLAREVYDKICHKVGPEKVALITGEEKIKPEKASYWVATVEAMPLDIDVDFLAIDEVQLASDPERGHVFTDRILHTRGRQETLFLGAQTMAGLLEDLIPKLNFISRPRLSKLSYTTQKKITRLPERSAVIAFSANEVYSLAELVRRQRGGAAVVLGALSPRTRNAQVALFQSGDVDYLVATDAIGMGLNLDVDYVAFSSIRKFDGQNFRILTPAEIAQIAGRAGRHMNDGLFGVTGACEPFTSELVESIETHTFDPVHVLQWRSRDLDFKSIHSLRKSLLSMPSHQRLTRARSAEDLIALEHLTEDPEVQALSVGEHAIMRLWEVCQLPDYRKISHQNHAELIGILYKDLMKPEGRINEDWFARQVKISNRTDGDLDTLANRLAHIRTWTFVSNRTDWLKDPVYWQQKTRDIENILSDALHECLTLRFVDRKTSVLMKGLREKALLEAVVSPDGSVQVEDQFVGKLRGFVFTPDIRTENFNAKAVKIAAAQVLEREFSRRTDNVIIDKNAAFDIDHQGQILWRGEEIARLVPSAHPLRPSIVLQADNYLSEFNKKRIQCRLDTWLDEILTNRLDPLVGVSKAGDITGFARGIIFSLIENFGALKREDYSKELKSLDQAARSQLRKYGIRFGAYNVYFPILLKPASTQLLFVLWSIHYNKTHGYFPSNWGLPPRPGLTSLSVNLSLPEAFYRVCGYHVCGVRAIRFDILERLSNIIRPLLSWKSQTNAKDTAPNGTSGDGGFFMTSEMISLLGCSPQELASVLEFMGFICEKRTSTHDLRDPQKKNNSLDASVDLSFKIDGQKIETEVGTSINIAGETTLNGSLVCIDKSRYPISNIWRPRRRFWENKTHLKSSKTHHDTKICTSKSSNLPEKVSLSSYVPHVRDLLKDEKLRFQSEGPTVSTERHSNRKNSTYQKYSPKNTFNKKDFTTSPQSKSVLKDSNGLESSSPFASLLKIKSKLERAQRGKGS